MPKKHEKKINAPRNKASCKAKGQALARKCEKVDSIHYACLLVRTDPKRIVRFRVASGFCRPQPPLGIEIGLYNNSTSSCKLYE